MRPAFCIAIPLFIYATWAGYVIAPTISEFIVPADGSASVLQTFSHHDSKTASSTNTITIAFAGDMMLDRQIRQLRANTNYDVFSEEVVDAFAIADIAIANLEGPVTTHPSTSMGSLPGTPENFGFTFAPASLEALKRIGIDAVSIGNNHIRDKGTDGVNQTKKHLSETNISYFGSPIGTGTSTIINQNGTRIGLIAYNEFFPPINDDAFLNDVQALAAQSDFTVVFPHWGVEYEKEPTKRQQELARAFIDAGADAVIGAHPHVVETFELYNEKTIAYSLGNFVFDQYFTEDVRNGVVLFFELDTESRSYRTYPFCTYLEKDGTTSKKECSNDVKSEAWMLGTY